MSGLIIPIAPSDETWRLWNRKQIYTGKPDGGNRVPNVGDTVISKQAGRVIFQEVMQVDPITGLSELSPLEIGSSGGDGDTSVVDGGLSPVVMTSLGGINGFIESYRCFIDQSVRPHTLSMDFRLKTYGSETMYMKVVIGNDIEKGEVISRMYDHTGVFISESIPLEIVSMEDTTNISVRRPVVGYSSKGLDNGELVTAIFYTESGRAVQVQSMLVRNSTWVRTMNDPVKYITSIHLESPFISEADTRVLDIPINIPVSAIPLKGVVTYSTGEKKELPVDGTKFALFGLNRFVSTKLGNRQPISLVYYLSPGEIGYGSVSSEMMHITETYNVQTTGVDGAYSLRVYSYPQWVDNISGYRLRHFLYSLKRDTWYDITENVTIAANSPGFQPTGYGVEQNITFAIDLSIVDRNNFKPYIHLQTTAITLRAPGTENRTNWTVGYINTEAPYGTNLVAASEFVNVNLSRLRINNGKGSLEHWIRDVYRTIQPVYDNTSEAEAPDPNYFLLRVGTWELECPISAWESTFTVPRTLSATDLVTIHFFRRSNNTDIHLGVAGLIVRRIN